MALSRGGGPVYARVNLCSYHSGLQEGNFRLKTRKKNIIYTLANLLFYLVFLQGQDYSHKYGYL